MFAYQYQIGVYIKLQTDLYNCLIALDGYKIKLLGGSVVVRKPCLTQTLGLTL